MRVLNEDGSITTEYMTADELGYEVNLTGDVSAASADDEGPLVELEQVDDGRRWADQYDDAVERVNRNMERLIDSRITIFALIAGTQKPGMMSKWVDENRDVFAREFSGAISLEEMAFIGMNIPDDNVVSPLKLTTEQVAEARSLYGSGPDSAQSYANMRNRMSMVRFVASGPGATRCWRLGTFSFAMRILCYSPTSAVPVSGPARMHGQVNR